MIFSANPWLFLLLAVPGLWLTHRIYFRSGLPLSNRRKRLLALLSASAWVLLSLFCVQPFRKLNPEVYHRPAVLLAVDESPSYAALGARANARASLARARRHYEALGFEVQEAGFAETVVTAAGFETARAGVLTRPSALRRALDSLAWPNLQAIFLWSDGRFAGDEDGLEPGPAPVFPVEVEVAGSEVQGENVTLEWARPAEDALARVSWRGAGSGAHAIEAVLEIRAAGKTVWTQRLSRAEGTAAEAAIEELRIPAARLAGSASVPPGDWRALLVPRSGNITVKNDTVDIRVKGPGRPRDVFIRPLVSLGERGLVDALAASDSTEITAVFPGEARPAARDVQWVSARRKLASADGEAGGRVEYFLPEDSDSAHPVFGADARVSWSEEGAEFLPAGVLRLADLGMEGRRLRPPGPKTEALAWVEERGRRGLLLWREPGNRTLRFAAPSLWRAGFHSGAGSGAQADMPARWARGVGDWARARGSARAVFPALLLAGRGFALEARLPARSEATSGPNPPSDISFRYDLMENFVRVASARGADGVRFDSLVFPAGLHRVRVERNGDVVWRGELRVRDPLDAELALLGADGEALARLAVASGGSLVNDEAPEKTAWPKLPGGQSREMRFRSAPLTPPFATALLIALSLCALWALRKRLQID